MIRGAASRLRFTYKVLLPTCSLVSHRTHIKPSIYDTLETPAEILYESSRPKTPRSYMSHERRPGWTRQDGGTMQEGNSQTCFRRSSRSSGEYLEIHLKLDKELKKSGKRGGGERVGVGVGVGGVLRVKDTRSRKSFNSAVN